MSLENGIKAFVTATATMEVKFPIDWNGKEYVRCDKCPFLSSNERICQLNKEPVHFPHSAIGAWCPLKFPEKEGE